MGYLDKQPSSRPITYWNWIIPAEVRKQRRRSANNCKGKRIYDSSTDDGRTTSWSPRPRNRTDVRFRHKADIGRTSAACPLLTQSGHWAWTFPRSPPRGKVLDFSLVLSAFLGGHGAARVHQSCRRRGGMAAYCACATGRAVAAYWRAHGPGRGRPAR